MPLRKPMTILIVEDNVTQAESLVMILKEMGHSVHKALTADAGMLMAKTHPPDVVILDWVMPGQSGSEFLKWLRSRPETRTVPAIVSTGLSIEALPCFDHDPNLRTLQKPYTVDQLNKAIADIQRESKSC